MSTSMQLKTCQETIGKTVKDVVQLGELQGTLYEDGSFTLFSICVASDGQYIESDDFKPQHCSDHEAIGLRFGLVTKEEVEELKLIRRQEFEKEKEESQLAAYKRLAAKYDPNYVAPRTMQERIMGQ